MTKVLSRNGHEVRRYGATTTNRDYCFTFGRFSSVRSASRYSPTTDCPTFARWRISSRPTFFMQDRVSNFTSFNGAYCLSFGVRH